MPDLELTIERAFGRAALNGRDRAFMYMRRRMSNALALGGGDGVAIGCAILGVGVVRSWWLGEPSIPGWAWYLPLAWWVGAALMGLLPSWGLGSVVELRRIMILICAVYASAATMLFLTEQAEEFSRMTVTLACLFSVFTIPLIRLRVKRILIRFDRWGVPAAMYGAGEISRNAVRILQEEKGLGFNPIAAFDDDRSRWGKDIAGVPVLGSTDLVTAQAAVAIVAMPGVRRGELVELLEGPLAQYRTVLIIPDLLELPSLWVRPRDISGMIGLEIVCNLASPMARFAKRTADVAFVLATAPLWVPMCSVLALLIWLEDRRHPLFLQERVGEGARVFQTWKFRTMVPNAEDVLQRKLDQDEKLLREWETTYKLQRDPRITWCGRWMRRFSLDELPQFVNVLRGEMSLVGPRPLPPYHHKILSSRARDLRERVRPGITGLWQVSGRSDIGTNGMEQWDPYYVRNWSIWLDIVVLMRTWRIVLRGSGAY